TFVAKAVPSDLPTVNFRDFSAGDDGIAKTMDDWKGKVVLLNLWATWCAPCRKEMPDLLKLKRELDGNDFDLVAVSIDRGGPEKPRKFLKQIDADALGVYQAASSEIAGPYKAFGMPTTLLIGRDGRELGRLVGPADWASEEAKALIRAAIAGAG
ncbi:MAG: TlpA family protein disulfide reductase, partial [Hyphomicrobiaceae bacterium]